MKVIDMTGKKTRVLSSYGDLKDQLGKSSSVTGTVHVHFVCLCFTLHFKAFELATCT